MAGRSRCAEGRMDKKTRSLAVVLTEWKTGCAWKTFERKAWVGVYGENGVDGSLEAQILICLPFLAE